MNTKGKILTDILFGNCTLEAGLPVRGYMSYPQLDGGEKVVYWRGNEGLILHLLERIEALEEKAKKVK